MIFLQRFFLCQIEGISQEGFLRPFTLISKVQLKKPSLCIKIFIKMLNLLVFQMQPCHLKQVVNTNKCIIHLHKHNNKLLISSVIDNLLKGASGQAIQNMNLMFGLEETEGLQLKATYF